MIAPSVDAVLRAHVSCLPSWALATSLSLAGILSPGRTFVCCSTLFACRAYLSMGCHGTPGMTYMKLDSPTISLTTKQLFSINLVGP